MRITKRQLDKLTEITLEEIAALGYSEVKRRFVDTDACEVRELTDSLGRAYTLHIEAWWEDEHDRSIHLFVSGNRGRGLGFTGRGSWRLLLPPAEV